MNYIILPCNRHLQNTYRLLLRDGIVRSDPCYFEHFLICCAPHLGSNIFRLIHETSLLWLQQRHLVVKREETGWEMVAELCLSVSPFYLKGSLTLVTYRRILRHGANGFTFPPKQVLLRIFIALKNISLSVANLGSVGKRDNHYTAENGNRVRNKYIYIFAYILWIRVRKTQKVNYCWRLQLNTNANAQLSQP
jgi:hypothetical protein